MLMSVIKDSIVLFLLLYALVSLAEQLVRFLSVCLTPKCSLPQGFYVLDVTGIPPEGLELTLRSYIAKNKGKILLLTDKSNRESADIITLLCNEFEHVTLLSRQQLAEQLTTQTALDTSAKTKQEEAPNPYI